MKKLTLTLAALGVAATGGVAFAEPSFSITGMIRQEIAANTGDANMHNSWGSPWNGRQIHQSYQKFGCLDPAYAHCLPDFTTTRSNVPD